jgi:protein-disulfide isomerase
MKRDAMFAWLGAAANATIIVALAVAAVRFFLGPTVPQPDPADLARFDELSSAGHSLGDSSAPIALVLFTDYQCPSCRAFEQTVRALRDSLETPFRIVVRHAPLHRIHPQARSAAQLAECSAREGSFEVVHDALFMFADDVRNERWDKILSSASVRDSAAERTLSCLRGGEMEAVLARDSVARGLFDFAGTPTLILPNQVTAGAPKFELLRRMVNGSLAATASRR